MFSNKAAGQQEMSGPAEATPLPGLTSSLMLSEPSSLTDTYQATRQQELSGVAETTVLPMLSEPV